MPNGKKLALVVRAEADDIGGLAQSLAKIIHEIGEGKDNGWDAQSYMFYITTKEPNQ